MIKTLINTTLYYVFILCIYCKIFLEIKFTNDKILTT